MKERHREKGHLKLGPFSPYALRIHASVKCGSLRVGSIKEQRSKYLKNKIMPINTLGK